MYISCQAGSMRNGSLPMSEPAHCSSRSRVPPSPMPVRPASVSTSATMLLWLKVGLRLGGCRMRTLVILAFGRAAHAGAAASNWRNARRFMDSSLMDTRGTMRPFIPQSDELSRIERDLRFHPSTVADPRTLTREQVAAFNRDGYLKPLRIFDSE